uniref:Pyrroline-5-carboxylate reductase 3 n=1 Tax=Gopherus agassizii TaxID=38772 RepID=A0A452ICG3_9SAUR
MEAREELRVGFVGAGRMAQGLAQGVVRAGRAPPPPHGLSRGTACLAPEVADLGCRTTHCNSEVLQHCTLVFLTTKPHLLPEVLQQIAPAVTRDHIIVSVAAGVTLQTLQQVSQFRPQSYCPRFSVLRVVPNLPCVVQEGAVVFARGSCAGEQEATLLKSLLSACGLCEETPESYMDIHTGLSGSGVAYVSALALAQQGAVKMGMPSALANKIAAQTLLVSLDFALCLQIPPLNPVLPPPSAPNAPFF